MFLQRETRVGRFVAEVGFTDTALDLREGPDPDRTEAAFERLGEAVGVPVVRMQQTHGAEVAVVDARGPRLVPEVDALVTLDPGVAVAARGADCGLVLLADVDNGVVAAVHSGRRGLVAGVVPATVDRMRQRGADRLHAWIGPHACGRCYEVPEGMREEVAAAVPQAWGETSWGTPAVDLGAGLRAQLEASQVSWEDGGVCTLEDTRVWSHRRDQHDAGRVAGLVWLRP